LNRFILTHHLRGLSSARLNPARNAAYPPINIPAPVPHHAIKATVTNIARIIAALAGLFQASAARPYRS
jgi:hypothetical protein